MGKPDTLGQAITDSGLKLRYLAEELGISRSTLRAKINGRREWKLSELVRLKRLMHMSDEDFWKAATNGL